LFVFAARVFTEGPLPGERRPEQKEKESGGKRESKSHGRRKL